MVRHQTWPSKKTAVEHVRKHSSYVFCIDEIALFRIMSVMARMHQRRFSSSLGIVGQVLVVEQSKLITRVQVVVKAMLTTVAG